MERAKIVDYYLQKINDKDFDLYDARKEMEKNNIEEEEIKVIIRLLDNQIHRGLIQKSHRDKSKEMIGIGAVLTFIGAGITIGTYTGILNTGDSFLIVFGPVVAGISILVGGLSLRKKV
ncbi:hypothetical protein [Algoriphagus winogradskyi]|uniref:Uncharacterized protein n=1 Tax=Algoriphagus winogradskyi TaxID=237017 RepID=A0ABY1PA48_9BACT|nr:hypothetical protein [Algoriphagus winogradskyi]SMP29908.1 hypothetical protein SAMN06265367_106221 [Algoriphagus winogradskyi]